MKCQTCGHDAAPPPAPEPDAWANPADLKELEPCDSDGFKVDYIDGVVLASRKIGTHTVPLYTAPLPSAGRPVTPCTPKEAREIAAQAGWRADDCDQWWGETERGFTRPRTEDLMRFADAARGVKSDG